MNRSALAVALFCLVSIPVVALVAGNARGEEPSARDEVVDPKEAVASVMKALQGNKGSVRVGMAVTTADRASQGAAKHIDQRFLPLSGSWLDKDRQLNGTIDWDVDLEKGTKVDIVRAVLLTGPFDKKEMEKAIVATGKGVGLALERDDEDPDTWYDPNATGIELWITLGDGIVVVEAEALVPD